MVAETWTAAAEQLAEDIREPGHAATALTASAWSARVDPGATRNLVRVVVILAGQEALSGVWASAPPCPDDAAFLRGAEDIEGDIAGMAKHAGDMASACDGMREQAIADWHEAQQQAQRAQAGLGADSPEARAAAHAALIDAQERMREAAAVIADCDAALEILAEVRARLRDALHCIRQVPADLAEAYETPYQLVRHGGKLPLSGDFLTGAA